MNQPAKMTSLQYSSILVCFLMNMLDGMDVMVISYAAPAITKAGVSEPKLWGWYSVQDWSECRLGL
jgi:hypothetical protein